MMKRLPAAILAAVLVFASIGAGPVRADGPAIDVRTKDGIGSYLTDERGMALYYFDYDSPGASACTGGCAGYWPALYVETITVPDGLDVHDFGSITREDGQKQTTYKGRPLYRFSGDRAPGDTTGDGMKGVWHVAKP